MRAIINTIMQKLITVKRRRNTSAICVGEATWVCQGESC